MANRATSSHGKVLQLVVTQSDKLMELSNVDMIANHLRKYGVAPYLCDRKIEQRVNEDISMVMETLGCDRKTAQGFLINRTVGIQPTVDEVPDDGGPDSGPVA